MIELTITEATEVTKKAIECAGEGPGFDSYPSESRVNAVAGTMFVVEALQKMGFRIERPTK